jgi:hypothetical protein
MEILSHMMYHGHEVFLCVPNQWANGREDEMKEWVKIANGLKLRKDLTSK